MNDLLDDLIASVDPLTLMRRIVEQVCSRMPVAAGASVCLLGPGGHLEVFATYGKTGPVQSRTSPIENAFETYCLRSGRPEIVHDTADDPRLLTDVRELSRSLGVRSLLSIPLIDTERSIGTLTLIAEAPYAFSDGDVARVSSISRFLGVLLSSTSQMARLLRDLLDPPGVSAETHSAAHLLASVVLPERTKSDDLRVVVDQLISDSGLRAVFQPIMDLSTRNIVGFEGLCRFPGDGTKGPDEWIALGHRVGRGHQLELKALQAVLDAAGAIPDRYYVAVNLSPRVIANAAIQRELRSARRDLVIELTEHDPASELAIASMKPLRDNGIRLAVDDAGSGFAGLTTILSLRPDIIKLDRELTAGLETDPARRALAAALAHFARETKAVTIAEGIENESQAKLLGELGIQHGQGFFLGRPLPSSELFGPNLPVQSC